jgi:2'-5' RNA ligase
MSSSLLRIMRHFWGTTIRKSAPIRVAYVIVPSDEVHNYVRKVGVGTLSKYGAVSDIEDCPHITVKQAFAVDALEPFERYLDNLAGEVEPFEIVIDGIGCFDPQGIVFLNVRPDPRLETLRQRILRDLSAQFGIQPYPLEDERYRFHATLASGLSDADCADARRALEKGRVEFRFMFDTLGLLYHSGGRWITYKRSRLVPRRSGPQA